MPSSIAHASVALLLIPVAGMRRASGRLVGFTALAAAAPDIDAIGRPFGMGDVSFLGGHRAVTHSVFAALVAGVAASALAGRTQAAHARLRIALYVTAVVASHGVLDTLTAYGEGVAFFAPFSMERWRSAWQPFSGLWPEVVGLWLPALLMYVAWRQARRVAPVAGPAS